MSDILKDATARPWAFETVRTSCGVCHKIGPWPHKWRAGEEMSACIYDDYPSPPQGTDTMLANARLIVTAVNAYEPMLAALERIAMRCGEPLEQDTRDGLRRDLRIAASLARNAIFQAKEQSS